MTSLPRDFLERFFHYWRDLQTHAVLGKRWEAAHNAIAASLRRNIAGLSVRQARRKP
jgi:hypothetical protein